jgi:hypothetical protein
MLIRMFIIVFILFLFLGCRIQQKSRYGFLHYETGPFLSFASSALTRASLF